MAMAAAMAPTAAVSTITADTALANYEAVLVGQLPGGCGAGRDIPSRPPGAPDGGYH